MRFVRSTLEANVTIRGNKEQLAVVRDWGFARALLYMKGELPAL